MPGSPDCYTAEVLSHLVLGLISAKDADTLASHIEQCDHCGEILDDLLSHDPLVTAARYVTSDEIPQVPASLIDRIRGLQPATVSEYSTETRDLKDARVGPEPWMALLSPAQQPDELGRLGDYRVLKATGTGGMGVVFQAEDIHLKRMVALKVMRPSLFDRTGSDRFLREARLAAAIKHEHVVLIYQVGEDRGCPFLAMEFLEGEPLDERLKRHGKLSMADVLQIGREIAEGLAAAHQLGLVHRDIKPANIWLENVKRHSVPASTEFVTADRDGKRAVEFRVKILDFGLARAGHEDVRLTQSGLIIGTPAYMAPEQARGVGVDHRSDLFSLGCVLYQACTGVRPFPGNDALAILNSLATHEPAAPSSLNPEVPAPLSDLIMRMLAKDPQRRPDSASEVEAALAAVAESVPAATRPAAPRSLWPAAVAAFALTLVAAVILAIIRIPTKMGDFVIETDDPQVAVAIENPDTVKLIHQTSGRHYLVKSQKLPEGDYELRVIDPSAGLEFSTRKFTVQARDPPTRVSVWFEKRIEEAAALPPVAPGSIPPRAIAPFPALHAAQFQEFWAAHLHVPVEFTNTLGMTLRLIPPGEFRMGSTPEEIQALLPLTQSWNHRNLESEAPPRQVRIEKPFYMGVHEVTVAQFRAFVQTGYRSAAERSGKGGRTWNMRTKRLENRPDWIWSHSFVTVTENHPVVLITSEDADAFLAWLSERDGRRYSLPTEEQWEFACRAGTVTRWYWGDDITQTRKHAWIKEPATSARQMPVGLKDPNPFGLFDMAGNVSEMAKVGDGEIIFRGGNAGFVPLDSRSASRELEDHQDPTYRNGFRVVCEP